MKKRINISIDYSIYRAVKDNGNIKNLSKFIEQCLYNHLTGNTNYRKTENFGNFEITPNLVEIANTKWMED